MVRASIIVGSVCVLLTSALTVLIANVASDNITLNESINHYGQEIDYIENQNRSVEKSYLRK